MSIGGVAPGSAGDSNNLADFLHRGWVKFPPDPPVIAWASSVLDMATACAQDPGLRARWLRCDGTWFVGVNALENSADGSVTSAGVEPLDGVALQFLREYAGPFALDRGQVSIVYPGYPRKGNEESDSAFRYRLRRHAAHVDGFERTMPGRKRRLSELHGFILGIPLTTTMSAASPLSVWEGSHEVFRSVFRAHFAGVAPERWCKVDSTSAYANAREECFRSCARVSLKAEPGESYVVHRLALHGIGPWNANLDTDPRVVVYFRPEMTGERLPIRWLSDS